MRKKLAIIGASYLQMPLVKKAKEMGVESICFAWEEGAVCKDVCDRFYPVSTVDKEEVLRICREIEIDGITTIASDVAVLTVNYVAEKMGLIGNPDKYSGFATNKYLMRQCFTEHKVPSPKFCLTEGDIPETVHSFHFPVIVKPTDRSGSRGVKKVDDANELQAAIERACKESFQKRAVIEEFVEGREISVESISFEGRHYVLQMTDKITTGSPFFVELEHHQPSTLPNEIKQRVKDIVLQALHALHIQFGASHAELKITKDGDIRVIEIGARMGGDFIGSDLVRLSTGYDFLKGVIEVALGSFEEPELKSNHYSGVYFLCKETEHLKPIIENYKKYPEIVEAEITDSVLRNIKCSADRSGYLIYKADCKKVF
ncbi:MAG: ATP-grasp domain-containing protein [Bacteroidaceae bacterium]|nr:ATP-grasp domain-containing protein [Bacteroidaceae bacterium]